MTRGKVTWSESFVNEKILRIIATTCSNECGLGVLPVVSLFVVDSHSPHCLFFSPFALSFILSDFLL